MKKKYLHTGKGLTLVSSSAWKKKKSIDAAVRGAGMLLSPGTLTSLNSIEKAQPKIMCATFDRNSRTTMVSCYSPTNARDESDITVFYDGLSSLAKHIPRNNVQIIGRGMNAQIDNDINNKFCLFNLPNRNCKYQTDFSLENRLSCLITKFQKRERKTMNLQITLKHN